MKNSLIVLAVIAFLILIFLGTILLTGWLVLFIARAVGLNTIALNWGNCALVGAAIYLLITLTGTWITNHNN